VHRIGRTGRAGAAGEAISLVAPEDHESLGAIEKLIKRRIDRVLLSGYEPNAGAVAGMIGREGGPREREREGRGRREREVPRIAPRRAERAPSDPIFSKPYEAERAVPASSLAPEPEVPDAPRSPRRERQVAALLGGLKRTA
jgi:superfamily II DNA/RNA helicase